MSDASARPIRREKKRRLNQKTRAPPPSGKLALAPPASDGDESDGDGCFLCRQSLDGSEQHTLKGHVFHRACLAAVRCHRRLATPPVADAAMDNEPEQWRADVRPLVRSDDRTTRSIAARERVKMKIRQSEEISSNMREESVLILNKRRFKSYVAFWDKLGSSSGSEEFESRRRHQRNKYSTANEHRVAIEDNERHMSAFGETTRTIFADAPERQPMGRCGRPLERSMETRRTNRTRSRERRRIGRSSACESKCDKRSACMSTATAQSDSDDFAGGSDDAGDFGDSDEEPKRSVSSASKRRPEADRVDLGQVQPIRDQRRAWSGVI